MRLDRNRWSLPPDNSEVRDLADRIIAAQLREIGEMKALIAELEANPPPSTAQDLEPGVPVD